jgi:hypothetical protein
MGNKAGSGQCPELPYHLGFSQATAGLVLWVLMAMNEVNELMNLEDISHIHMRGN